MAQFELAVRLTLVHEGGFVDNPVDPGGATNMGVTQKDMPDIDIRDLTVAQAEAFYRKKFWNPLYDQITEQNVADKIFDFGVLFGIGTAVRKLQEILEPHFSDVAADGDFGPKTLRAVNNSEPTSLLAAYKTAFVSRAIAIGAANPAEQQFMTGWVRRINS